MFLQNSIDLINLVIELKIAIGLGLSTVKRILTLHNSDFSLNNGENSVIFSFTLKKQDLINIRLTLNKIAHNMEVKK